MYDTHTFLCPGLSNRKNSTVLVQISIKLMGVHQNVPIKPHRGPIIYSKEDLLTD